MPNKTITDYLGECELLEQLAEECGELTQAAMKLKRTFSNKNPTPVTQPEARARLVEECADVLLIVELLLDIDELVKMSDWVEFKSDRWLKRLKEGNCENDKAGIHNT